MAQKDYIVKNANIEYEGLFCFDDVYKHIKTWLARRGYGMQESGYKEVKAESRNIKISIDAMKEASDYVMFLIELSIKLEDLKEVKKKGDKKIWHNGKLKISFSGLTVKDFENQWSKNAVTIFIREAYDKFVIGSKLSAMEKQLEEDIYKFTNELKSFLKLLKLW